MIKAIFTDLFSDLPLFIHINQSLQTLTCPHHTYNSTHYQRSLEQMIPQKSYHRTQTLKQSPELCKRTKCYNYWNVVPNSLPFFSCTAYTMVHTKPRNWRLRFLNLVGHLRGWWEGKKDQFHAGIRKKQALLSDVLISTDRLSPPPYPNHHPTPHHHLGEMWLFLP